MKINIYIILFIVLISCNNQAQERLFPNYKKITKLIEFSDNDDVIPFELNVNNKIAFNHKGINYFKVDMTYFGTFFLSIKDGTIYSVTGDINNVYNEDILLSIDENKQILGNPFKGSACFFDKRINSTYYFHCSDSFSSNNEDIPIEIKMIAISEDKGFEQIVIRNKNSEKYYISLQ